MDPNSLLQDLQGSAEGSLETEVICVRIVDNASILILKLAEKKVSSSFN